MKLFGIKSIVINGSVLHTYNIMVKNSSINLDIINQNGLKSSIAGRHENRLKLTFTTLDFEKFDVETRKLGKVLKQIAQANLDAKYHWVK
jgi:hypothetical protein